MKQDTKSRETVKQPTTSTSTVKPQGGSSTNRPNLSSGGIITVRKYSYDDNGGGYRGL